MNKLINCLLTIITITAATPLKADLLGSEDDSYIGVQFSIPLASKSSSLFAQQNKTSFMLVNQDSGIKDGIALTLDGSGNQTWGYVRPSRSFDIASSDLSQHIMPIASFDDEGKVKAESFDGFDLLMTAAFGVAIFITLVDDAVDFLEEAEDEEDATDD